MEKQIWLSLIIVLSICLHQSGQKNSTLNSLNQCSPLDQAKPDQNNPNLILSTESGLILSTSDRQMGQVVDILGCLSANQVLVGSSRVACISRLEWYPSVPKCVPKNLYIKSRENSNKNYNKGNLIRIYIYWCRLG